MNVASIADVSGVTWDRALLALCDGAVKGFVVLLLAGALASLLRRRSAAARHLTWLMAFIAGSRAGGRRLGRVWRRAGWRGEHRAGQARGKRRSAPWIGAGRRSVRLPD